jgi:hypothetical protein
MLGFVLGLGPIVDPPPVVVPPASLADLDGTNGFRLEGIDAGDDSGFSVAGAGHVNGDGFSDLIVGAPGAAPSGDYNAGESYVVFGRASGFGASLDLATLDGTNGFRLDGIDPRDLSGSSVAGAGDVNGDGFGDLIVGAYYGDPGGEADAGESYVVFGRASGFGASLELAALDGTNGFRLDGIDAGDSSGGSVAGAGDVNGDGFSDLIVGAAGAAPSGDYNAGESYVVFGRASGFGASVELATLDGTNGFRLDGIDEPDLSGRSVASAGDVNGDGFGDVIIVLFSPVVAAKVTSCSAKRRVSVLTSTSRPSTAPTASASTASLAAAAGRSPRPGTSTATASPISSSALPLSLATRISMSVRVTLCSAEPRGLVPASTLQPWTAPTVSASTASRRLVAVVSRSPRLGRQR